LIIVADPWEGFWTGILLRIMLKSNIPIQVQFHGDFLDPNWRKINFKNRIKYCLLKINFYKFDSIRAVGERQARDLERNLKVSPKVISVNPIPITLETNANQKDHIRPRSLGFVGRIHSDRGLTKFVELVESLNSVSTDFSVVIAGAGPLTKRFIRKLNAIIPKNRLTYFGNVSYSEMSKVWRQIGVLVSTAPAEAYGMAIRESLISGVPVWATQSSGVLDLLDSAEPGTVKLLNFKKDESKLYKDFEALLKVKVGPKFRDKFIKENNLYAEKLVSSWIDTIENFKK
jgi:glycosyltransferase involved in cell wall biosynthesis